VIVFSEVCLLLRSEHRGPWPAFRLYYYCCCCCCYYYYVFYYYFPLFVCLSTE